MKIQFQTSWHLSDILLMKNINPKWVHEHSSIIKTGGDGDMYFKAQIRHDQNGRFRLKVYGLNSDSVTIDLKTKSEKKAMELADSYLDSINMINYGFDNEFDLQ